METSNENLPASELITKRITDLGDWRGETLQRMRKLIQVSGAISQKRIAPNTTSQSPQHHFQPFHQRLILLYRSNRNPQKLTDSRLGKMTHDNAFFT